MSVAVAVIVDGGPKGGLRARDRRGRGPAMASGDVGVAGLAGGDGGLLWRHLFAGLTGGAVADGEKLNALGDDVDARRVAAVLGLELVEQQPAVEGDLTAGLEVVDAGVRLAVEALDVEVAVLALLARPLDRDPHAADRSPVAGLEQLGVLGQVAGGGPAVHLGSSCPVGRSCG